MITIKKKDHAIREKKVYKIAEENEYYNIFIF